MRRVFKLILELPVAFVVTRHLFSVYFAAESEADTQATCPISEHDAGSIDDNLAEEMSLQPDGVTHAEDNTTHAREEQNIGEKGFQINTCVIASFYSYPKLSFCLFCSRV